MPRPALGVRGWLPLVLAGALSGGTAFQPRPIEPAKVAAGFGARSLADPGLRAYVAASLPAGRPALPPGTLDLTALTLTAFYYHSDLDLARAAVGVADAAVVTAGGRPNPVIVLSPEFDAGALRGVSPWILGLSVEVPVETAGKRGFRIERAEHLSEAAAPSPRASG